MVVPIFARPDEVFSLADRDAFVALLERFGVPYRMWGDATKAPEEVFEEHWKEIENRDAVYTTGSLHHEPKNLVRFIITLAIRVVMDHPRHGMLVLIEYVRDKDFYRPRKHTSSSLSEKVKLTSAGLVDEPDAETIRRCLFEEPRINIDVETLKRGLHFMSWPLLNPLVGGAARVEQDYRAKPLETPGLTTFNQIAHYSAYLPEECYFRGWRQDEATKYLSRWVSLTEQDRRLEPIPVDRVPELV